MCLGTQQVNQTCVGRCLEDTVKNISNNWFRPPKGAYSLYVFALREIHMFIPAASYSHHPWLNTSQV